MKIVNGYPVATPDGAIWIVEVSESIVLRDAEYPTQPYQTEDEDSAVEAIESGLVLNNDWLIEHESV